MGSVISILQMGIWIIIAIMIFLVVLYFYIMTLSQNKINNITMSNNNINSDAYDNSDSFEDNALNSNTNEDDGPIQHL